VALPGRRGVHRIETLVGLAQALRRREGGDDAQNDRDVERALAEAEALLEDHPDERQVVHVALERAAWDLEQEHFEAALRIVRRVATRPLDPDLAWHVRDREASVLTAWSVTAPERREEALAANRALLPDEHAQTTRRQAIVRSRLRVLRAPADPLTPEVLGREALHWWQGELGDGPLGPDLVSALETRIRREERDAFRQPSGRALVRMEADLAPLVVRLSAELLRAGDAMRAVAYLAHLGAWPWRRALRWTDFAASPSVGRLRWSRILEDRLAEALAWGQALDRSGMRPPPAAPGSVDRLQRYLSGQSDQAFLSADDLTALWRMPPEERSPAAAELRRGIESGIDATLDELAADRPQLFNSVAQPPFVAPGHFARRLQAREAIVLVQNVDTDLVLGAAWRTASGDTGATVSRTAVAAGSDGELPLHAELSVLATALREAGVTRVGVVCRGVLARAIAAVFTPLSSIGARLVHLPGVDAVSLPALDRRRSRRYLVLLDPRPEQALPCIHAVSQTLQEAGYVVLRPGATLDEGSAAGMADAQSVIFAGHGEGTIGPFGPAIGGQPVSHFDQLPLGGSAWAVTMACSVGSSGRLEDLRWGHDDPAGAAEHLLLAGCRAAADCTSPVPEVLAALILEELASRTTGGEEPEAAFAATVDGWLRFWSALEDPLAADLAAGLPLEERALAGWLTARLDAERRRRLGREVGPLPPDGLYRTLGVRAPASTTEARDPAWARETAGRVLAAIIQPDTWAAFRWVARR
jgi:hypothetical protein